MAAVQCGYRAGDAIFPLGAAMLKQAEGVCRHRSTKATFLWLIRVISWPSHTPRGAAGKTPTHTLKLSHDTHTHTLHGPVKTTGAILLSQRQWVMTSVETAVKHTEGCRVSLSATCLSGLLFHTSKMASLWLKSVPAAPPTWVQQLTCFPVRMMTSHSVNVQQIHFTSKLLKTHIV